MLESKEEDDFLSSSDSYSSSSEEEDSDVSCTPEKKTKSNGMFSTPKSSRKPSVHTPAKTPRKTVRFLIATDVFKSLEHRVTEEHKEL